MAAATNLNLAPVNGQVLTADRFATVRLLDGGSGPFPGILGTNWANEAGPDWTEGNGASLTYTVTGVDNPYQVVAIAVATTGGAAVTTIYGQIVAYGSDSFFLHGYEGFDPATGALTLPLTAEGGVQDYFKMSDTTVSPGGQTADLPTSTSGRGPFGTREGFTACFAAGTRIATAHGDAAVEHIQMGDLIRTVSGALQPVIWVGTRTIDAARHPQPARVMPVRIQPGAFGPGLPHRPLTLSPEHAVFADGAMVPVHTLINGSTIRQFATETITYYHIELPHHDALFAEGLPAESYLDTGNRTALSPRTHATA